MTYRNLRNLVLGPLFAQFEQFEQIFCFALSVCFYAPTCPSGEKNCMVCMFAVTLIFLLPSDHVVGKVSVSHGNELWKYIMNLIVLETSLLRRLQAQTLPHEAPLIG